MNKMVKESKRLLASGRRWWRAENTTDRAKCGAISSIDAFYWMIRNL